jgi:hypothetical protein
MRFVSIYSSRKQSEKILNHLANEERRKANKSNEKPSNTIKFRFLDMATKITRNSAYKYRTLYWERRSTIIYGMPLIYIYILFTMFRSTPSWSFPFPSPLCAHTHQQNCFQQRTKKNSMNLYCRPIWSTGKLAIIRVIMDCFKCNFPKTMPLAITFHTFRMVYTHLPLKLYEFF